MSGPAGHCGASAASGTSVASVLGRPAPEAAPPLLGCTLTHTTSEGPVAVQLTEVEAYAGEGDPASHAGRGPTPRTAIMYGSAGLLYVYFSYGMHWCANIVVGSEGEAAAVLLRAGRVLVGADLARARRGQRVPDRGLARGPACLTQALGIGRGQNGADLLSDPAFTLTAGSRPAATSCGPRVGVSLAPEVRWRFWVTGDETVSAYKRSHRADSPGSEP